MNKKLTYKGKFQLIIFESLIFTIASYYLKNSNNDFLGININTIVPLFFNLKNNLDIYLGLIGIISTIYIYCLSISDTFKKNILIYLLGEDEILYILIKGLLFYFLNICPILYIGLVAKLFYKLLVSLETLFLIMDHQKFKDNFQNRVVKKYKEAGENNGLANLYEEIKINLYNAILNKNILNVREMIYYLKNFLIYPNGKLEEEKTFIEYIFKIYLYLLENREDNIFLEISDLPVQLGDAFIKEKEYKTSLSYYSLLEKNYLYYHKYKDIEEKHIEWEIFRPLAFKYSNNYDELIVYEGAMIKILYSMLEKKDFIIFKKFFDYYKLENFFYEENKIIKLYSHLIILFFLKHLEIDNIEDAKELKTLIEENLCYYESYFEEIYNQNKKLGLIEKLKIEEVLWPKPDFMGISSMVTNIKQDIKNLLIEWIERDRIILTEKFINQNKEEFEFVNSEFIKSQIKRFDNLK